jgi:hypothetical protein
MLEKEREDTKQVKQQQAELVPCATIIVSVLDEEETDATRARGESTKGFVGHGHFCVGLLFIFLVFSANQIESL